MKERVYQRRDSTFCSKCSEKLDDTRIGKQRYCKKCHAEHMILTRPKHSDLSEDAKKKANARAYFNVYLGKGKIIKKPCCICGDENSQAHHEDYDKPLEVIWYCRKHHLEYHAGTVRDNFS